MYPMSHAYHQEQIERLRAAFAPFFPATTPLVPKMYVAAGQPIFSGHEIEAQTYLVTSGEIVILRNGQPVDLLEEDELLDLRLWPGTTAKALSSCTLVPLSKIAQLH